MALQDHGALAAVRGRAVLLSSALLAMPTLSACSTLLAPPPDVAEAERDTVAGPVYSCQREPEGTRILKVVKDSESH